MNEPRRKSMWAYDWFPYCFSSFYFVYMHFSFFLVFLFCSVDGCFQSGFYFKSTKHFISFCSFAGSSLCGKQHIASSILYNFCYPHQKTMQHIFTSNQQKIIKKIKTPTQKLKIKQQRCEQEHIWFLNGNFFFLNGSMLRSIISIMPFQWRVLRWDCGHGRLSLMNGLGYYYFQVLDFKLVQYLIFQLQLVTRMA